MGLVALVFIVMPLMVRALTPYLLVVLFFTELENRNGPSWQFLGSLFDTKEYGNGSVKTG